jgi:hypothetical protein
MGRQPLANWDGERVPVGTPPELCNDLTCNHRLMATGVLIADLLSDSDGPYSTPPQPYPTVASRALLVRLRQEIGQSQGDVLAG